MIDFLKKIYEPEIKTKIIVFFIIFTPVIDMIYGGNQYILEINFPIHQGIRFIFALYFAFDVKDKLNKIILSIVSGLLIVGTLVHYYQGYLLSPTENLGYILKIINLTAIFLSFYENIRNKLLTVEGISKYITWSTLLISSNVIISNLFRIGLETYTKNLARTGYKGLFATHNSINATLLLTLPIVFFYSIKSKKKFAFIIFIFNNIALILIGTKAGVLGSVWVILFSIIALIVYYKKYITRKHVIRISIISAIILLIGALLLGDRFSKFYQEQVRIFNQHPKDRLFSYVVSNRDLQVFYVKRYIRVNNDFNPAYTFGFGYSKANKIINDAKHHFKSIEMDFYGLYYYSGLWSALLIFGAIIAIFIINLIRFKGQKDKFMAYSFMFSIFLALFHSTLGGHVIYEAISGTYFGIVLAIGLLLCKKENLIYK